MTDAALRFDCPRCHHLVDERLYGPCRSCRVQLSESQGRAVEGEPVDVGVSRFEPGLHVVPNHVATKE